jgi:hypothetical protein
MRDFRIDECECWVGATTLEADHACLGSAVLQPCTLPLLPSCSWSSGVASELRSSVIVIAVSISNGVQVCIAIRYLESASGGVSSFRICYMARRRALARLEGSIQARPIGKWINTQQRHRQRTNHIHLDPIKKTKSRPRKRARNIPPNAQRGLGGHAATCLCNGAKAPQPLGVSARFPSLIVRQSRFLSDEIPVIPSTRILHIGADITPLARIRERKRNLRGVDSCSLPIIWQGFFCFIARRGVCLHTRGKTPRLTHCRADSSWPAPSSQASRGCLETVFPVCHVPP